MDNATGRRNRLAAFTLVELLIVIGVLSILGVVVILTLNPVELLRQSRDTRRLGDIGALSHALSLYETDQTDGSMGSSTVIYISIPDSSATCGNLGLPDLPSSWSYACVASSTLQDVDGTGWVPVDLTEISSGSPLGTLPIDPINTTSTSRYYTYTTGGSFKLTSRLESEKRISLQADDGGADPAIYESGSDLDLAPLAHGLIGWWKFDGDYTDSSGSGNDGTASGNTSLVAGKTGQAVSFDGADDYVSIGNGLSAGFPTFSMTLWINIAEIQIDAVVERGTWNTGEFGLFIHNGGALDFQSHFQDFQTGGSLTVNNWHFVAVTLDGNSGQVRVYQDGALVASDTTTGGIPSDTDVTYFGSRTGTGSFLNGKLDDIRIYNRALSADEVQAAYDATN